MVEVETTLQNRSKWWTGGTNL